MNEISVLAEITAQAAGAEAAMDYFNNNNRDAIVDFQADAKSNHVQTRHQAINALGGFMIQAAKILEAFQTQHPVVIEPKPPSTARVCYLLSRGVDSGDAEPLPTLKAAMDALKKSIPTARASFKVDTKPAEPPKAEKPQQIEIVSMPDRESVQTIEHDSDGEIVRAVKKERDA